MILKDKTKEESVSRGRTVHIHEYQAKEILKQYGIPIPSFGVAQTAEEAARIVETLSLQEAVIKIQVHAGGRGKAGGVQFGKGKEEIVAMASQLIGKHLVNEQTGPQGVMAGSVLISQPVSIAQEYYLGAIIDRAHKQPLLIASSAGGVEIETIAQHSPHHILRLPIELQGEIRPFRLVRLCQFMGWKGHRAQQGMHIAQGLAKAFTHTDASLLEINPLVADTEGNLWALDAKLSVDDNALFRQQELAAFYDPTQQSPQEAAAKAFDLAYIALKGNIGCMVNGAGLAMATMDLIQQEGGTPANFLDVGGSASKEKISEGFKIILQDPQVRAVLVHIFGGIMNCATLAEGIIAAVQEIGIRVPLVVRMEGTQVEEGKRQLRESRLAIITADTLQQAAEIVCKAAKGE